MPGMVREQLRRVRPAWEGCTVPYVTTSFSRKKELEDEAKNEISHRGNAVRAALPELKQILFENLEK